MRVDVRDVIAPAIGTNRAPVHNPEALLTLALRWGIPPKPKAEESKASAKQNQNNQEEDDDAQETATDSQPKGETAAQKNMREMIENLDQNKAENMTHEKVNRTRTREK